MSSPLIEDFHDIEDEVSKKKTFNKKIFIILTISVSLLVAITVGVLFSYKYYNTGNNPEKVSDKDLERVSYKASENASDDPVTSRKKLPGVKYHTIQEIKQRIKANTPTSSEVTYKVKPSAVSPFAIGKLSDTTLNNALIIFNNYRYLAGISSNVTLTDKYNELAQAASVLMAANKKMAHSDQPQPAGMAKSIYDLGVEGCDSCNLYSGIRDLNSAIHGWVRDSGKFDTMGHRRWILNPSMKSTGFGITNYYAAMYFLDNALGATEFYGVAWPGMNTPLSYFGKNDAWTYSLGKSIKKDIKVTLKNLKDGSVLTFDKSTISVENSYYGQPGCIAFKPSLDYKNGDTFEVGIHGTEVNVDYTVYFFDL